MLKHKKASRSQQGRWSAAGDQRGAAISAGEMICSRDVRGIERWLLSLQEL